mmetsp:Transcript_78225/g.171506  ORF Transcript_78225/g.171506 Transcript_78225/m.171506 type:complete len:467 (+) Transcript_78225:181-1581(+)
MASAMQTDQSHRGSATVERFTLSRTNSGEQHPELMAGGSGRGLFPLDASENQAAAASENQALKEALAAATQKLAQMEEDSQCFLDEKVFDLVNTMCMGNRSNTVPGGSAGTSRGGAGGAADDGDGDDDETLRLENTQLRLQLLDQQQANKDRVQELEAQFESFCKKVLTMTAGGNSLPSPAASDGEQASAEPRGMETTTAATAAAAAAAAAASPRSRCSLAPSEDGMASALSASCSPESRRGRGSSASASASAAMAAGTPNTEAAEDEFQDAEEEGVSGTGRNNGAAASALRTLLEEARKRSQALEEMSERRERIIIDLDLQTRTLEKRLRASEARVDLLEKENDQLRQCIRLGKDATFVPVPPSPAAATAAAGSFISKQTQLAPPPASINVSSCGSVAGSPREHLPESPVISSPVPCSSFGSEEEEEEEEDDEEGKDEKEEGGDDDGPAMMRKRTSLIDELEECW